jgi:hypothetical protein
MKEPPSKYAEVLTRLESSESNTKRDRAKLEAMRRQRRDEAQFRTAKRIAEKATPTEAILSEINSVAYVALEQEDDIVVSALKRLIALDCMAINFPASKKSWKGTVTDLAVLIEQLTPPDKRHLLPRSVYALGKSLRRIQLWTMDLFQISFTRAAGRNLVAITVYKEKHLKTANSPEDSMEGCGG